MFSAFLPHQQTPAGIEASVRSRTTPADRENARLTRKRHGLAPVRRWGGLSPAGIRGTEVSGSAEGSRDLPVGRERNVGRQCLHPDSRIHPPLPPASCLAHHGCRHGQVRGDTTPWMAGKAILRCERFIAGPRRRARPAHRRPAACADGKRPDWRAPADRPGTLPPSAA